MSYEEEFPQSSFHVERTLNGLIKIECPSVMFVRDDTAAEMGKVLFAMIGAEVIFADPGQTVIRSNGNGKIIR